jgi:hypothetical protein
MSQVHEDIWNEDLQVISRTPENLRPLLADLGEPLLRVRASPDEFSALEQVCHLRDIDAEAYAIRITRLLSENSPQLPDIDGSRLAVERAYQEQDLQAALQSFTEKRAEVVALLKGVTEAQKNRSGHLETVGEVSVRRVLSMMREHDEGHLDELRVLRQRLLKIRASN